MLKMVTVTGADDSVKPSDLAAGAAEYPFVEFGILFRGAENRTKDYPVISGKSGTTSVANRGDDENEVQAPSFGSDSNPGLYHLLDQWCRA